MDFLRVDALKYDSGWIPFCLFLVLMNSSKIFIGHVNCESSLPEKRLEIQIWDQRGRFGVGA